LTKISDDLKAASPDFEKNAIHSNLTVTNHGLGMKILLPPLLLAPGKKK